jgi:hypothetical protein
MPYASDVLTDENVEWAWRILKDPGHDSWFLDKAAFAKEVGGTDGLAAAMTANQLSVFNISVDAAALVFMHSALDAAVQDLCLVCALVAPSDCEGFIAAQKVSLADLKGADYAALLRGRLSKYVTALERESLLKRVDLLFQLCRPTDFARTGYSYDRARLEKSDRDRQSVIHGDGVVLDDIASDLEYLFETGLFLFGMVNHRYGVRIDPQLVTESHGWARLSPKPLQPTSGAVGQGSTTQS